MELETAEWLLTEKGRELSRLAAGLYAQRSELVQALSALRRSAAPEQASAVWELANLRQRAQAKFGDDAQRMWFVREALEQASGFRAAAYHARRFIAVGFGSVIDLGCGIGADSLAFARAGLSVTAYENDPVRALFAAENARALGFSEQIRVVPEDGLIALQKRAPLAIWLDPARRLQQRRVGNPEDYAPPLSTLHSLDMHSVGVKLSPAIDHSLAERYGADLEFVSDGGECKEGLLWSGALRRGVPLCAAVLFQETELRLISEFGENPAIAPPDAGGFLYEPDPAVIRAGGIATLARTLRAKLAAPGIAYLIATDFTETGLADAYAILERFSYSQSRLQKALTARNVGEAVIKKRGFPQEPDSVRKILKLRGSRSIIVVLTRAADGNGHQAILCQRMS